MQAKLLYLEHMLTAVQPRSLLLYGAVAEKLKQDCALSEAITVLDFGQVDNLERYYDMALVDLSAVAYDAKDLTSWLGCLRNQFARQIVVIIDNSAAFGLRDFIALGFKRDEDYQAADSACFTYDLNAYNKKREWNNARFWANPEMFNKARW